MSLCLTLQRVSICYLALKRWSKTKEKHKADIWSGSGLSLTISGQQTAHGPPLNYSSPLAMGTEVSVRITNSGGRRMARQLRAVFSQLQFPARVSGSSQPPVTPAPGLLTSFWSEAPSRTWHTDKQQNIFIFLTTVSERVSAFFQNDLHPQRYPCF